MRKQTKIIGQGYLMPQPINPLDAFKKIRNYLAGQFVGATRDEALLDEVIKCLFCKLEIDKQKLSIADFSRDIFKFAGEIRNIFVSVKKTFNDIFDNNSEILLDPKSLHFVLNSLDFSQIDTSNDLVSDAYEVFTNEDVLSASGQFFTPRTVTNLLVKSINPKPGDVILDPACGAGGFLTTVYYHYKSLNISNVEIENEIRNNIYGIDKDAYLARLARIHLSLLSGVMPKICCKDSLSNYKSDNKSNNYTPDSVDIILTNPPFGSKIVAASENVMSTYQLARKWVVDKKNGKLCPTDILKKNVPPQVLFIELCTILLKEGGMLGIVVPESLLSNKKYQYVVEYLMQYFDIKAILGMPDSLFKTSGKGGTHTKTCLVIAKKEGDILKRSSTIFMAEAVWCGKDSRARIIPNNDLPELSMNYLAFKNNNYNKTSNLGYVVYKKNIIDNILCPRYYNPDIKIQLESQSNYINYNFGELVNKKILSISTGHEIGKLAYGTGNIPFIRTSDISNWELKSDPKHGVSYDIYETLKQKQDVKAGDILMVKDGTYLVGTCALVTEYDEEILFQSHIYKIRVNKNEIGLNPYLLLAILSSNAVQMQIKSKQFTLDIIDSLGDRINEIILPIPKNTDSRDKISKLVSSAIRKRMEAKVLVNEAKSVLGV